MGTRATRAQHDEAEALATAGRAAPFNAFVRRVTEPVARCAVWDPRYGFTALHAACNGKGGGDGAHGWRGVVHALLLLLPDAAFVNAQTRKSRDAALHYAVAPSAGVLHPRADVVAALLAAGGDARLVNCAGFNPLQWAREVATGGDAETIVQMLEGAVEDGGDGVTIGRTYLARNPPEEGLFAHLAGEEDDAAEAADDDASRPEQLRLLVAGGAGSARALSASPSGTSSPALSRADSGRRLFVETLDGASTCSGDALLADVRAATDSTSLLGSLRRMASAVKTEPAHGLTRAAVSRAGKDKRRQLGAAAWTPEIATAFGGIMRGLRR